MILLELNQLVEVGSSFKVLEINGRQVCEYGDIHNHRDEYNSLNAR